MKPVTSLERSLRMSLSPAGTEIVLALGLLVPVAGYTTLHCYTVYDKLVKNLNGNIWPEQALNLKEKLENYKKKSHYFAANCLNNFFALSWTNSIQKIFYTSLYCITCGGQGGLPLHTSSCCRMPGRYSL